MARPLSLPQRLLTNAAAAVFGHSVRTAVPPLARFLDTPPAEPVSAFRRRTRLPLTGKDCDPVNADRLDAVTRALVD